MADQQTQMAKQQTRYGVLLDRWEQQADKYDSILDMQENALAK